jgi:DNA-binding MarR family transcriptional regulator
MSVITRILKKDSDRWLATGESGPCACSLLRRVTRKVTALYDEALQTAGLTVTQYAILVNVGRAGQISRSALAAQLGMDRTTLTRNLIPLEKQLLTVAYRSKDLRARLLGISPAGRRKLRQSFTLWENAQKKFASQIGLDALEQFRAVLEVAEASAVAASSRPKLHV